MKKIPITQNKFIIVDDEDYPVLSRFFWHFIKNKTPTFPYCCYKAPSEKTKSRTTFNIPITSFLKEYKQKVGRFGIAINGNYLDCRKNNIEMVHCLLKKQTAHKVKTFRGRKPHSKYKGVSWNNVCSIRNKKKPWRAYINPRIRNGVDVGRGHQIRLGSFKTENEAGLAYNKKAREFYGDLAYQNEIK